MKNTKSALKERSVRREKLIRSLQDRGLINEDSSLRSIRGSLYDAIASYVSDPYDIDPDILGEEVESWLLAVEPIYEDDSLDKPENWDDFVELLDSICECPDDYVNGSALYELEQALNDFALELVLIDPSGYEFEVF